MLYQWEVGRVERARSDRDLLAGARRRTHELPRAAARRSPTGWSRGTIARVDGDRRAASRRTRRTGASSAWRCIDRLVLRLAIYELLTEPETPAKVVINEALELARTFSGEEAVRVRQRRARRGAEDLERE